MQRYTIVLGGQAGQGVNTVETLLIRVFKESGYHVFATKEYMSRVRGGLNTVTISISSEAVRSYSDQIDFLIPFTSGIIGWLGHRVHARTILLGQRDFIDSADQTHQVAALEWLDDEDEKQFKKHLNILCGAMVAAIFNVDMLHVQRHIEQEFQDKGEQAVHDNLAAAAYGYQQGVALKKRHHWAMEVRANPEVKEHLLLNGSEAVAIGALCGGCNALSFYPMSPSTAVAIFLIQHAETFELAVEQYEDEIAAAAACVGTWYAGGRGLITTSGGGFALMEEVTSLAGMSETPLVIHLAQRPGPATGLPTRTAQGDLNLVLYAGHGDFPRTIFAPGNIEQALELSARAFAMADHFQTPAFILTDEYLVDTCYNCDRMQLPETVPLEIVKTSGDYQRYHAAPDGISPRGIPGNGDGIVLANGNEHDAYGDTTEELNLSKTMPDKRMSKLTAMVELALEPELLGDKNYRTLVIGWGSTYETLKAAINQLKRPGLALLHFSQVYPLPPSVKQTLHQASQIICVEQNMTGQLADLLQRDYGCAINDRILKYDGRAFSDEQLCSALEPLLKGERHV